MFATTTSGEVKLGAGAPVDLDEMTAYSSACFKALKAAGDLKAETADETFKFDRVMLNCRKTVIADSQGRFKFERVKSGKYWVSAYIRWKSNRGFWTGAGSRVRRSLTVRRKPASSSGRELRDLHRLRRPGPHPPVDILADLPGAVERVGQVVFAHARVEVAEKLVDLLIVHPGVIREPLADLRVRKVPSAPHHRS